MRERVKKYSCRNYRKEREARKNTKWTMKRIASRRELEAGRDARKSRRLTRYTGLTWERARGRGVKRQKEGRLD